MITTDTILKNCIAIFSLSVLMAGCSPSSTEPKAAAVKASLSVELMAVEQKMMPLTLSVNGSMAAWQEVMVSSQLTGVKINSLFAEVGDVVTKGQTLAVFDQETVQLDLAQARTGVAEAQALYDQAKLNASLVRGMLEQGASSAISRQELNQLLAAEKTAQARLMSAKTLQTQHEVRLRNTTVRALDAGVISSRTAVVGAVPSSGQELFRLIRQQRLEWQAEVTGSEVAKIKKGMPVTLFNGTDSFNGRVRAIGPMINLQSRNATVHVDVAEAYNKGLKPGMYLHGQFSWGEKMVATIPQTAVIEREGFTYAFILDEQTSQVQRIKLMVNKAQGEFVEVLEGLKPGQKIVKSGVAFLAHGDLVKVVQ